jgi:hypothetical protein
MSAGVPDLSFSSSISFLSLLFRPSVTHITEGKPVDSWPVPVPNTPTRTFLQNDRGRSPPPSTQGVGTLPPSGSVERGPPHPLSANEGGPPNDPALTWNTRPFTRSRPRPVPGWPPHNLLLPLEKAG